MQRKDILFLAVLIVVVLGVYGRSLDYDLIWDSQNFLGESFVQSEKQDLCSALTQGYFVEPYTDKSHYYRPLTLATFFFENSLWGIKGVSLRSVNILIYLLSLILLFVFFKRQSPGQHFPEIATALFALYPLNLENLVWVVGRGDLLLFFWGILTFLSYELWISKQKHAYWILSCLFFTFGLLSKEGFVFLLPTLLLFAIVKQKKVPIPYGVILVMVSTAFFFLKARVIGIKNLDYYLFPEPVTNVQSFLASLGYYFKTLIFPVFYDRFTTLENLRHASYLVLGIAAVFACAYILFRGKKDASLLIPLSLVVVVTCAHTLLIFTSIFQFRVFARYMMLPGLGLVWILSHYLAKAEIKIKIPVAAFILVLFAVSISLNITAYRSNIHFWQRARASLPQNGFVLYSLASAYADNQDFLSTELCLNQALSQTLDPSTALSVSLLYADIDYRKGEYTNVLKWLDSGEHNLGYPGTKLARHRSSQIKLLRGQVYLSQGKITEAIQIFTNNIKALEGSKAQKDAYLCLFSLYLGQEMWGKAEELETRIREDHPTALDKQTVQIKDIFKRSSPEKKVRFYTHYMNYARAIRATLSLPDINVDGQLALAELFYFADKEDEAQKVIDTILSEKREDHRILNAIGHFYLNRLLRAKEAVVFFNKSLAVHKDQPEITRLVRRLQNDFLSQLKEVW